MLSSLRSRFCSSSLRLAAPFLVAVMVGCAHSPPPAPPSPTAQPDNTIAPPPATAAVSPATVAPSTAPSGTSLPSTASASALPSNTSKPVIRDPRKVATTEALTPSGTNRYQCVAASDASGAGTPIELPSNTLRVCSRFPAMGPCQYERDACRAKGGRVIRFDGVEIDKDVEREYDKQVQRFRLNAG